MTVSSAILRVTMANVTCYVDHFNMLSLPFSLHVFTDEAQTMNRLPNILLEM